MFNNSTLNATPPGIPVPYYGKIPWTAAFSLEFVMAMMGNFLIVWIVFRDIRLRRSATNFLIANMAVSDLIAALFAFPWVLVYINFDRQWLIGGVIAIVCSPNMYFRNTLQFGNLVYCGVLGKNRSSHLSYYYTWQGLTSILPMVLITITYTFTICKLYHRQVPGLLTSERRRRREQQNKKVLKHAVTIVVLLYLCHGFQFTFHMLFSQRKLDYLSFSSYNNLRDTATACTNYCGPCTLTLTTSTLSILAHNTPHMLIFTEGGTPEDPEKNSRGKGENNTSDKLKLTYGPCPGIETGPQR
ncbi:Pyroglutamylated RFamide peptide receptor [Exaiptasia diaphana]|nr:Pyroglutamylated RFamide peptide receptor [Exaiptasia diaphana]